MGVRRADIDALQRWAACLSTHGDTIAAHDTGLPPAGSFQSSAVAVAAVHDGVREVTRELVSRMTATGERVTAAAREFGKTEDSSAAALRSSCCGG